MVLEIVHKFQRFAYGEFEFIEQKTEKLVKYLGKSRGITPQWKMW
jgi:hypothetical protein